MVSHQPMPMVCAAVAELALQGKLIASATFKNTSVFTLVALMYLGLSLPLILAVRHFEKRTGRP
jgi:polar amino acid transport system permease protein